jgi:hypothetical protein
MKVPKGHVRVLGARDRERHHEAAVSALLRAAAAINDSHSRESLALALVEAGRGILHVAYLDTDEGGHDLALEALARVKA